MPALTRRRYPERQDCWHVFYADVHVGTISRRVGQPLDLDPWEWSCGFYPGCHPGEHTNGTAATFDRARAEFECAWEVFLSRRTEEDFREWRDHRDRTAWKYRMRAFGRKMPTEFPTGRSHCFCGAPIEIATADRHVLAEHRT
ncbi:hypothetical protein FFI89_017360 [Bradyrhizobium sp. KBS0727]|uniref:hypothetical protein n=1 Tax=unclassified Bradyrhizobium TaxID=2631580 RepID=UPI00110E837A|nr:MULTISPECIES: hypothetical protein [unclassified Bradyrhizobium]QDW38756.1 hypothetical protein FFI71_017355 [Bradyrhizobium sp. KBS0725]QDW45360.1 hypothetical protein FFI89_017360 [Bradyrhizobium sp. KBS0727]